MATESTQVALVDDHRLFRSGIALLINNFEGYKVILEAGNGKEFCEKIGKKLKPDIVLLDINMPVMDGTATAAWVKQNRPAMCVIILSMLDDPDKVLALVKLGIKGYLLKDAEPQEFKEALDTVSAGEIYYPPFVMKLLLGNLQVPVKINGIKLNRKELEFLRLASTELTYKEIAHHMLVSTRTVDNYRDQLFEKLSVKSRVGLVMYAVKNKLLQI